jgi:hypothetical protein
VILRTCILLTIPALAGCVSPWASAPHTLSVASETASWDPSYRDLSAEAFDGEGDGEFSTVRRFAKHNASGPPSPPIAPRPALTRVASASSNSFLLAAPLVEAEDDERAHLARAMDERHH